MNHETQRLLVAASRGARVQTAYGAGGGWRNTGVLYTYSPELQRIHPKDVRLQYGAISTELREEAESDSGYVRNSLSMGQRYLFDLWFSEMWFQNTDLYRWLCAFAAELAADEGL